MLKGKNEIKYKTLRAQRVINDMSLEDMAGMLKVSTKTYWNKEAGLTPFTVDEAKLVCQVFRQSFEYLF